MDEGDKIKKRPIVFSLDSFLLGCLVGLLVAMVMVGLATTILH